MKKIFFAFTFIILTTHLFGQQLVNISSSPKTVPPGKKWVLKINDEVLTDLSDLSLRDGNLCNTQLRSNPRSLGVIIEGEIGRPNKIFSLELKDLIKEPYTSQSTYKLIVSNIHSNVEHEKKLIRQIIFYPGERVFVSTCIANLQFFEMDLTPDEKFQVDQKQKLKSEIEEREKNEVETRKIYIENIRSKQYDLKEFSPKEYDKAIKTQIAGIYSYFNRSNKNTYPLYFPSFEDFAFSEEKYQRFEGIFRMKYVIPIYRNNGGYGENVADYINEFSSISGGDKYQDLAARIAVPFKNLQVEDISVETEIVFDSLNIDFTRGISEIKNNNGKVKFLNKVPTENLKSELEAEIKKLEKGSYIVKYEYGNILGVKILNIWTEEK